jgi:murein DD-endopeptidase MepM/ murein hydrolase activator NlpD
MVFILRPYFNFKLPAQTGLGGGIPANSVILADDAAVSEALEFLDTSVLEPELFSETHLLLYNTHVVKSGENISGLAVTYGLNQDTLISINRITNTRLLRSGQFIKIPNQDGIFHTVTRDDSLNSLAERYNTSPHAIQIANELFADRIDPGMELFIPGARLDRVRLQEINGDLFIWPVSGRITSFFGYRRSPFTGQRQFHNGIDIRANMGTPIRAAMAGRVTSAGYDNSLGYYVVITHHSGYRTLYGHLSTIRTNVGAYVGTGTIIGNVGNTGLSTGPHLHFTVFRNGFAVNPRVLLR